MHGELKCNMQQHRVVFMVLITSPLMRTQSSWPGKTAGFPNSQLVKLTVEWSVQSNSPSVFMSFSPIQSSSVDAAERGRKHSFESTVSYLCY